jgi:hypothetical protein
MNQRSSTSPTHDDGCPEADGYDTNYLTAGIDPLLHPGWQTLRRIASDDLRDDAESPQRVRLHTAANWLRRQVARLTGAFA